MKTRTKEKVRKELEFEGSYRRKSCSHCSLSLHAFKKELWFQLQFAFVKKFQNLAATVILTVHVACWLQMAEQVGPMYHEVNGSDFGQAQSKYRIPARLIKARL